MLRQFVFIKNSLLGFFGYQPKASSLLKDAQRLIKTGWVQGAYIKYDRGFRKPLAFCAMGALQHAASYGRYKNLIPATNILSDVLSKRGSPLSGSNYCDVDVIAFNDTKGRTKEEVLDLFDSAIGLAKLKESNS